MTVAHGSMAGSVHADVVLLVGHEAVALAERLRASGYAPINWNAADDSGLVVGTNSVPVAAILASDQGASVLELRSRFDSLPILIGVSDDSIAARESVLACGADDFWFPLSAPSDLLQRLRLHLSIQSRSALRPPMLQLADLNVDITCRQVRRGTRSLVLTAREYALLMLLLNGFMFVIRQPATLLPGNLKLPFTPLLSGRLSHLRILGTAGRTSLSLGSIRFCA